MISLGDLAKAGLWVTAVETGILARDPYLSRWGISLAYHPDLTASDIMGMTQERAAGILTSATYWPEAWNALPPYLCVPVLAFSVLQGPTWAARALQSALGVAADGDVGPATCAAANAAKPLDPLNGLLRRNFEAQCRRLQEDARWLIDGVGWAGRCAAAMAAGAVAAAAETGRPA